MLPSFNHEFVERAEVVMRHDGKGFVSDVLVVTANIPLLETTRGFDQAKVDALCDAAVAYSAANGNPYNSICFKGYDHADRT